MADSPETSLRRDWKFAQTKGFSRRRSPAVAEHRNKVILSRKIFRVGGILKKKQEAKTMEENRLYDVLILGGGPGGYTAALYAARAGLKTAVIEKLSAGGQLALTEIIENYPGVEQGIDGWALSESMQRQAERFGAVTLGAEVFSADLLTQPKRVETSDGVYYGKSVILATGKAQKSWAFPGRRS